MTLIRWKHFSERERNVLIRRRSDGVTYKLIARELNRPHRSLEELARRMGLAKRREK